MSKEPSRPAGVRQIAMALDISIGTVDRALHGRSGVSPETRDRVLKMAQKLSYSPNVAARNLRLNRRLRLGVFLPEQIASFFDPLRDGLKSAADDWLGPPIDMTFHSYPRLGEGEIQAMTSADWQQYDGVIVAPGDPAAIEALSRKAGVSTPMVYVATDASHGTRLASVAIDAVVSGGIAAELLGHLLSAPAPVVTFTGDLRIQDHADKLRGFAVSLAALAPHLSLLPAIETHESPDQAYDAALKIFRAQPDLGGVYINTANSLPVLTAADEAGLPGRLRVITTDLFPELFPRIEAGQVFATLDQRPFVQGRTAFEMLGRFLTAGAVPKQTTRLAPHIILRSNLPLFKDHFLRSR